MNKQLAVIVIFLVSVFILSLYLSDNSTGSNKPQTYTSEVKPQLGYEIINISPVGSTMWKMEVKITNINNFNIRSAQGTAVLMDGTGREICTENHYIVKDDLPPGASTYFTFIIDCDKTPASGKLHIERIR